MLAPRRAATAPALAVAAYAAVVGLPLVVLFVRVAVRRPPVPTAFVSPQAATTDDPDPLPPFDAYGAAEAPPFPDLALSGVHDGEPVPLSAVRRGPVLLHFWSASCESCVDEWASLHSFARTPRPASTPVPPLLSVLVVPEGGPDPAAAALAALDAIRRDGWFGRRVPEVDAAWAVAEDRVLSRSGAATADRPLTGYPETFVLDEHGRIRLRLVGPMTWDEAAWAHVLALLPDLRTRAAEEATE
jgi:thiol-disulfide isomerase/thioredoxin